MSNTKTRFSITLDSDIVEALDDFAAVMEQARSTVLNGILREGIDQIRTTTATLSQLKNLKSKAIENVVSSIDISAVEEDVETLKKALLKFNSDVAGHFDNPPATDRGVTPHEN